MKKLSLITAGLIAYSLLVLLFAINIPAAKKVNIVNNEQFFAVLGQSMWITVDNIIALTLSQLIEVTVF